VVATIQHVVAADELQVRFNATKRSAT